MARYAFAQHYCRDKRVLDGACGTGYGSALLGKVARSIVGIDCSGEAIEYATQRYSDDRVAFRRAFVEDTPFADDTFDVIVSFETVEHTLCPRAHMMEICRLLEPEHGCAIVSVPNAWGYTDHHFFDFDRAMLEAVLEPFFAEVELYYQNPSAEAGSRQPGIGPLAASGPHDAQCLIAVCRTPKKAAVVCDRHAFVMDEIYRNVFERHQEFLTLSYRQNTSLARRTWNRLRLVARQTFAGDGA